MARGSNTTLRIAKVPDKQRFWAAYGADSPQAGPTHHIDAGMRARPQGRRRSRRYNVELIQNDSPNDGAHIYLRTTQSVGYWYKGANSTPGHLRKGKRGRWPRRPHDQFRGDLGQRGDNRVQGPDAPTATATVAADVDVYNAKNEPDGAGQVVGVLRAGNGVTLVGDCTPDSWCEVSGNSVPSGHGWVWGYLQLS